MKDTSFELFSIILAVVFALIIIGVIADFVHHFTKELRFLNMEIRRNYGKERKYWERRRRQLWLSLIPFIRY